MYLNDTFFMFYELKLKFSLKKGLNGKSVASVKLTDEKNSKSLKNFS